VLSDVPSGEQIKHTAMNILVIMLYWYPYEGPLMPIYGAIFKELSKRGHNLTIVASFPHYRKGRKETWQEYRGRLYEITVWEGIKLIRCYVQAPLFNQRKSALLYRALNFVSFNITSPFAALLLAGRADIIFAPSSPPLSNGIVAWLVSKFKRGAMVYNVQDLYPDMAVKMGLIGSELFLTMLRVIEKIVYRLSTKVLTISGHMRNIISGKGVPSKKIEVIENFIDTQFITPGEQDNVFSRVNGLVGKFVVMYAGNIGVPHGVEILVDAAERLAAEAGIVFCFVARGENRDEVMLLAREKGLKNAVFLPPQPEETVPLIWASASVGVITYRKGLADYSVPSKLLAMMCAARPVIASVDEDSEIARIVSRSRCGIVAPAGNVNRLVEAILMLRNDAEKGLDMGRGGRVFAEMNFRKEIVVDRYESLFKSLIVNRR
jgi:colanic acid biosynthesis glycosyl transferase WcaI